MSQRQISSVEPISVGNFWGVDSFRDPAAGQDYGIGTVSTNQGRRLRRPLEPRVSLRPVTSSNSQHLLGGRVLALGAMASGGRLNLIVRLSGGRLVAITDVERV